VFLVVARFGKKKDVVLGITMMRMKGGEGTYESVPGSQHAQEREGLTKILKKKIAGAGQAGRWGKKKGS